MEGYILGGKNIPESEFKREFRQHYGSKELKNFEALFHDSFITESDFKKITRLGANVLRVPFHYKIIERAPFRYSKLGFSYLDKIISWAEKYELGVILDLHAAPGAQNADWHADSSGRALLWEIPQLRERTYQLWEAIAARYKNRRGLVGYDLVNEPVVNNTKKKVVHSFYKALIKRIRKIDTRHIIFLEGNLWATQIDFLKDLIESGVHISIHFYQPLDYVFHFLPSTRYPGRIAKYNWRKDALRRCLERYYRFSRRNKTNILVGEFGVNWRGGHYGEGRYLNDVLSLFEAFGFHYTFWTYKTIKNYIFPDGLYQYLNNPSWVNREGPLTGWETYWGEWGKNKKSIVSSWDTRNYTLCQGLTGVLRKYFKRNKK